MKRNLFWMFVFTLLTSTLTLSSCEDDPCKDVVCGDNGTCFDGDCICDVGYEKDVDGLCTVEQREKFTGNFRTDEICTDATSGDNFDASFTTIITAKSGDIERINLQGFGNSGNTIITGKVNENSVTIDPDQTIIVDGLEFLILNGSGTISGNTITFEYDLANPANSNIEFNCTATAQRL